MLKYIVLIVIIQLFYGTGITLLVYAMPTSEINILEYYQEPANDFKATDIASTIRSNLQSQTNIPVVDIGALVFYSGNIILDVIVNFFTMIPSLLAILIRSFYTFFPIDAYVATQISLFVWVIASFVYAIALISFILSIRSQTRGPV